MSMNYVLWALIVISLIVIVGLVRLPGREPSLLKMKRLGVKANLKLAGISLLSMIVGYFIAVLIYQL